MNWRSKRVKGFTLVELLVAMATGMIIISVASSVLQNTVKESVKIKDAAMLQETSFFMSHLLEQHLRQAGYRGIDNSLIVGRRIPIVSNADAFPEVAGQWLEGQYLKSAADTLSIRFNGSSNSAGNADGSLIDCHGESVAAGVVEVVTLTLAAGQLLCTSGGVQTVLVGSDDTVDVVQFLIRLGIDDGQDGSIDRYVDSASLTNADLKAIREVVLRLLLVSNQSLNASGRTYDFDNAQISYTDDRFRREVVVRVALRNVLEL